MFERYLQAIATDDAPGGDLSEVRERLKGRFPPGAIRRMTTLGMLVGSALGELEPREDDAVIYASGYAESRTLEGFLDSFPTPSPTLFQSSIQPSAVQQLLIGRQCSIGEFLPLSGGSLLVFHALRAAFLSPAARVLLCGGEERGTWLLQHGLASARTFSFGLSLTLEPGAAPVGRLRLGRSEGGGELALLAWFELIRARAGFSGFVAPGWQLDLEWL
jgi:hypothetical protein